MISQTVDNVLSTSASKLWQFGRLCYSSPLPIHSSIPRTLATLSPFNSTNKVYQFVPHSRASHDFSNHITLTNQNKVSLCLKNHNKDSICPVIYQKPNQEISPNSLSTSQIPLFSKKVVIVPELTNTVRFSTISRIVRHDAELYNVVLGVLHAVQHGKPCNRDYVPFMVPLSFIQGLKTSKRSNTH
jgi:hypothetical protein